MAAPRIASAAFEWCGFQEARGLRTRPWLVAPGRSAHGS